MSQQNGELQAFNSRMRAECLNHHWFLSLDDAIEKIERWRVDYNLVRPHSAIGNPTPAQFAQLNQEPGRVA
ncbi:MAG: transposase [Desulfatiglandales bacterium]